MALKVDYRSAATGATFTGAYVSVSHLRINKASVEIQGKRNNSYSIQFQAHIYATHANFLAGKRPLEVSDHVAVCNPGLPIHTQAYGHLRSLPEFSGAMDA